VANLAEEITIDHQFDINSNSHKYLGCALFDAKLAIADAAKSIVTA